MKFLYYDVNESCEIVESVANLSIADILKIAHTCKVENAGTEIGIRINTLLPFTAERHNKVTIWINMLSETISVTRHSFNSILDVWCDEDMKELEISDSEIETLLAFKDEYFTENFSSK